MPSEDRTTASEVAELIMTEHTVRAVDADLAELSGMIAKLGDLCISQVTTAVEALVDHDALRGEQVLAEEPQIDALHRAIEQKVVGIVARRQPMAVDLREIIGALRISNDLERVGDLAENVAERALLPDEGFRLSDVMPRFELMADLVLAQLREVMLSYQRHDVAAALEVWRKDEEIDVIENSLFRQLLTYMMENPRNIAFCSHLLLCSKNIERMGDHATNIAESIYYIVEGHQLSGQRPKASMIGDGTDLTTG
jgi:phosphate transport system protein